MFGSFHLSVTRVVIYQGAEGESLTLVSNLTLLFTSALLEFVVKNYTHNY